MHGAWMFALLCIFVYARYPRCERLVFLRWCLSNVQHSGVSSFIWFLSSVQTFPAVKAPQQLVTSTVRASHYWPSGVVLGQVDQAIAIVEMSALRTAPTASA